MATIKVNKEIFVEGKLTVERTLVKGENNSNRVIISGGFTTHDYFEEIQTLESERYLLQNVEVHKEYFGSNDYDIGYEFIAGNLTIKEDYIPQEIRNLIEYMNYKEENAEYFHSKSWEKALDAYEELSEESEERRE